MTQLARIGKFLDRELRVDEFTDSSHNGVQVASSGRVRRVCCGVDASMEFFEACNSPRETRSIRAADRPPNRHLRDPQNRR